MKLFKCIKNPSSGYTFVEILVVIGILVTLSGVVTINLLSVKNTTSLSTSVDQLVNDMETQQLSAVTGNTEGRSSADSYGVYFGPTSYTLFHGSVYNANDSSNFTVNLGDQIQFSNITFPGSVVVFTKGTGEITGFVNGSNSVTLLHTGSHNQTTIQLNTLGVITQVQ